MRPCRGLLRPHVGRYGLCDYEKVFCAGVKPGEDIFALRSIDRAHGCMVIVRPDEHVGHVLPLDARNELSAFFAGILRVKERKMSSVARTKRAFQR